MLNPQPGPQPRRQLIVGPACGKVQGVGKWVRACCNPGRRLKLNAAFREENKTDSLHQATKPRRTRVPPQQKRCVPVACVTSHPLRNLTTAIRGVDKNFVAPNYRPRQTVPPQTSVKPHISVDMAPLIRARIQVKIPEPVGKPLRGTPRIATHGASSPRQYVPVNRALTLTPHTGQRSPGTRFATLFSQPQRPADVRGLVIGPLRDLAVLVPGGAPLRHVGPMHLGEHIIKANSPHASRTEENID